MSEKKEEGEEAKAGEAEAKKGAGKAGGINVVSLVLTAVLAGGASFAGAKFGGGSHGGGGGGGGHGAAAEGAAGAAACSRRVLGAGGIGGAGGMIGAPVAAGGGGVCAANDPASLFWLTCSSPWSVSRVDHAHLCQRNRRGRARRLCGMGRTPHAPGRRIRAARAPNGAIAHRTGCRRVHRIRA